MTEAVFNQDSFLAKLSPNDGKYMASCLNFRGQVKYKEFDDAV